MKNLILLLAVVLAIFLVACNLSRLLTETGVTITPPGQSNSEIAPPVSSEIPATGSALASTVLPEPMVYYYFVEITSDAIPAGSVVILPDVLILAPTPSGFVRVPDIAVNLDSALQAMIDDPRNAWTSSNLGITSITFNEGHAGVVLQGEIHGAGDVVLIAARMQILMTVFAEASVQTATVTLNGESIGNLGISLSSEAKPADYAYTRAEIETFMAEHASPTP